MAHKDSSVSRTDKAYKTRAEYTCLYLCALFDSRGVAAEEGEVLFVLYSYLVAASALGHIQCLTCHFLAFPQVAAASADTDGKGNWSMLGNKYLMHLIEN